MAASVLLLREKNSKLCIWRYAKKIIANYSQWFLLNIIAKKWQSDIECFLLMKVFHKVQNISNILKPTAFCWKSFVFINMSKVSTLPNLALKALKIVPASKQKWYSFHKKELNVFLIKFQSKSLSPSLPPPPPFPTHTHTHTQTKPSTNKPNPQISQKPVIPPTNYRKPSHIKHNPDKYRTNHPLIFINQKLHSSLPEDIFDD